MFFLLPGWLKLNHLKRRMECGSSDIFSRHICSTVAETIGVTNYAASFGAKNVQKTTFKLLVPWKLLQRLFYCFSCSPDWLKLNHLKNRMDCSFSDIFSCHICSTVAETIAVTNYVASFGTKNVQKTPFEAAEIMLGPWNQQGRFAGAGR